MDIIIPNSIEEFRYLIGPDSQGYEVISEAITGGMVDPLRRRFRAISGRSLCQNGNGRVYPRDILDAAFIEFYEKFVKADSGLGEIEHPVREKDAYKVPYELAAIKVTDLKKRDDDPDTWWGDYITTSFGKGPIVRGVIDDNIKFGVSTRGFGRFKDPKTKKDIIEYHIRAIDVVMDPSTPGAFGESIKESAEKIMESRIFIMDPASGEFLERSYDNLAKSLKNGSNEKIIHATRMFLDCLREK